MIKEPDEFVRVTIKNNSNGVCTQPKIFSSPEPGMIMHWDFLFDEQDISIRIDWPMKVEPIIIAGRDFVLGWKHFLTKINWDQTNLDAEAVRFMNEVPGRIEAAVKDAEGR